MFIIFIPKNSPDPPSHQCPNKERIPLQGTCHLFVYFVALFFEPEATQ